MCIRDRLRLSVVLQSGCYDFEDEVYPQYSQRSDETSDAAMSWYSKVVWSEGMFLRPQHFQQQDRYLEALVRQSCGDLRLSLIHI